MLRRGSVAALAAFGSLIGLLTLGVLAGPSSAAGAKSVAVVSSASKLVVRPSSFVISSADDNSELDKILWTSWGTKSAAGVATYHVNNCTPTCVAGKFVNYSATVQFNEPKSTKLGELFTNLHVAYKAGKKSTAFNFPLVTTKE